VIGLTETMARTRLAAVDIYRATFRPLKSTLSGRGNRMLMKLVVDGSTDRVVGCHMVGPDAAELIQLIAVLVTMKARKADFDATMALHPTAAEELVTMRKPVAPYKSEAAE
jgi:glutathione reductase (NADPH)